MPKLTKSYVDRLVAGPKRYAVRCSDLRGFEIRVNRDGTKTASALYFMGGRQRRVTLGRLCETYTFAQARADAAEVLIEARKGRDIAGERARLRKAPTFKEAADAYLARCRARRRSESTIESYTGILRRVLLPAFGNMRAPDITTEDVERLQAELAGAPSSANLVMAVLSAILGHCERAGHIDRNPCRSIERFQTTARARVLSSEERAKLTAALDDAEHAPKGHPHHLSRSNVAAIRLLVLTGCRRTEITRLTWEEVDVEGGILHLATSKSGPRAVPLSAAAVSYLRTLRAETGGTGYVCPTSTGKPVRDIWRPWRILLKRAGLQGLCIHDLRRTAATDALEAGVPPGLISGILGHASTRTTEIYLRPRLNAYRDAAKRMGEAIEKQTKAGAAKLRDEKDE